MLPKVYPMFTVLVREKNSNGNMVLTRARNFKHSGKAEECVKMLRDRGLVDVELVYNHAEPNHKRAAWIYGSMKSLHKGI